MLLTFKQGKLHYLYFSFSELELAPFIPAGGAEVAKTLQGHSLSLSL